MATETDKVNNGALATLTMVGAAATLAIALAVTALVRHEAHSVTDERSAASDAEVRALKAGQREKLNASPAWADKAKSSVTLPIDRAMGLVVSDLQKDPRKATPPAPPGAADAGAGAAEAGDAGAGAGAGAADAAAPAPEGAAPTEAPKPEVPKPEEKKKPKPGGTVGSAPIVPSPVAPPSPAVPSQP